MTVRMSDDPFAQVMSELRRHIKACPQCRLAMDDRGRSTLCHSGNIYALRIASNSERLLTLKRKAYKSNCEYIYACPDLSKHGEAYAMSAVPFAVSGVQGELF